MLAILMAEKRSGTSVKMKLDVRISYDTMPKTVETRRHCEEGMQQSSATECSLSSLQCLLVSTFFGMVSSLHPTSCMLYDCKGLNFNISQ